MKSIICVLLLFSVSFSQSAKNNFHLSGNFKSDSKLIQKEFEAQQYVKHSFQNEKRKSPFLGAIMSLLIPGSGEIYAEEYWKAAIFIAVEAAAITTAVIYDKKGDDKTAEFENFANQHWSAKRYAEWTLRNLPTLNPSLNPADFNVINPDGTVNWSELNRLERAIGYGYSHTLAPFGDQQYYEMIGKYPQFSHGWSDSNPDDTDYHILSPFFRYYSNMRGKANDLYKVASTAVIFIYVNHFLSALDAAWSVAGYNKNLAMKVRMEQINLAGQIEYVPTLNFSLSF